LPATQLTPPTGDADFVKNRPRSRVPLSRKFTSGYYDDSVASGRRGAAGERSLEDAPQTLGYELGNAEDKKLPYFDGDEAGHAVQAEWKYFGPGHPSNSAHQAHVLSVARHGFGKAFSIDPLSHGAGSLLGDTLGSGGVFVAGRYAQAAGKEEYGESREKAPQFARFHAALSSETAFAADAARRSPELARRARTVVERGRVRETIATIAGGRNARAGMIGLFSLLSGIAIMARAGTEIFRNLGLAVAGQTTAPATYAQQNPKAGAFAQVTGGLSNAFAAFAAGCAVFLGFHFSRKADEATKTWEAGRAEVEAHLRPIAAGTGAEARYAAFVLDKTEHRGAFLKSYGRKDRIFLIGASLYAFGTLATIAVEAGVRLSKKISDATKPIVLTVLSALGIGGALAMGIFSHQFFFGHPRTSRYDRALVLDTPDLNRRLLSHPEARDLRTSFYALTRTRERVRERLLAKIADARGRSFTPTVHSEDAGYRKGTLRSKYAERFGARRLRDEDVRDAITSGAHDADVLEALDDLLAAEITHHAKALGKQTRLFDAFADAAGSRDAAHLAEIAVGSPAVARERLAEIRELHAAVRDPRARERIVALQDAFLRLRASEPEEHETTSRHFARYLREVAPLEERDGRGALLEIEREAVRL
jgi:hypothetical protein